jgi:hypothetical protein
MSEMLTRDQLRERIESFIPPQTNADEVVAAVGLALTEPEAVTRPIERDLLVKKRLYAWSEKDVPVVEPALRILGELVTGGFFSPKFIGVSIAEMVGFLIRLRTHRSKLDDPALIAVLLTLTTGPKGGLSASAIADRLAAEATAPLAGVTAVERALETLATPDGDDRPHALVERSGSVWKSLV